MKLTFLTLFYFLTIKTTAFGSPKEELQALENNVYALGYVKDLTVKWDNEFKLLPDSGEKLKNLTQKIHPLPLDLLVFYVKSRKETIEQVQKKAASVIKFLHNENFMPPRLQTKMIPYISKKHPPGIYFWLILKEQETARRGEVITTLYEQEVYLKDNQNLVNNDVNKNDTAIQSTNQGISSDHFLWISIFVNYAMYQDLQAPKTHMNGPLFAVNFSFLRFSPFFIYGTFRSLSEDNIKQNGYSFGVGATKSLVTREWFNLYGVPKIGLSSKTDHLQDTGENHSTMSASIGAQLLLSFNFTKLAVTPELMTEITGERQSWLWVAGIGVKKLF